MARTTLVNSFNDTDSTIEEFYLGAFTVIVLPQPQFKINIRYMQKNRVSQCPNDNKNVAEDSGVPEAEKYITRRVRLCGRKLVCKRNTDKTLLYVVGQWKRSEEHTSELQSQ